MNHSWDFWWMTSFERHTDVPICVGWNSCTIEDHLLQQASGYMKNICLPPGRLYSCWDIEGFSDSGRGVWAALCHSNIWSGCNKACSKIQEKEAPQYDNVFICFWAFHIILAYFSGIGFVLANSGGPEVLIGTGVLAPGSCNGFLSDKHYDQWARLHPLLANSTQSYISGVFSHIMALCK